MHKLSVAIATYNEEKNIGRCLKSVEKLADEIVIADGKSSDRTVEIANQFKAKIISTTNKPMFHINKQQAIEACTGDWILALDADEEVSPELSREITQLLKTPLPIESWSVSATKAKLFQKHQSLIETRDKIEPVKTGAIRGFYLPRANFFINRALRHGGIYPDGVIRLFQNGYGFLPCKSVHEQVAINGRVSWLEHDLIHYDSPTLDRYWKRANRYTSLTAKQYQDNQVNSGIWGHFWYLFLLPLKDFCFRLIRHKAILDGVPGILFALFSALHHPIAYIKYQELKLKHSHQNSSKND